MRGLGRPAESGVHLPVALASQGAREVRAMAGLKPENPNWKVNVDSDFEIVVWNDPVWTPALRSLTDNSDPKPIAALLRRGEVPPFEVLERLGIMLDPPNGYLWSSLVLKTPKRTWRDAGRALGEDRKLRQRILDLTDEFGSREAAIAKVREETKLSRAKLFETLKLDNEETFLRSQTMLGYGGDAPKKASPRKKGKSNGL